MKKITRKQFLQVALSITPVAGAMALTGCSSANGSASDGSASATTLLKPGFYSLSEHPELVTGYTSYDYYFIPDEGDYISTEEFTNYAGEKYKSWYLWAITGGLETLPPPTGEGFYPVWFGTEPPFTLDFISAYTDGYVGYQDGDAVIKDGTIMDAVMAAEEGYFDCTIVDFYFDTNSFNEDEAEGRKWRESNISGGLVFLFDDDNRAEQGSNTDTLKAWEENCYYFKASFFVSPYDEIYSRVMNNDVSEELCDTSDPYLYINYILGVYGTPDYVSATPYAAGQAMIPCDENGDYILKYFLRYDREDYCVEIYVAEHGNALEHTVQYKPTVYITYYSSKAIEYMHKDNSDYKNVDVDYFNMADLT
ncbi:MAG: hypothetical protein R3Y06_10800 [Faecalibacterium sp.]